jgi:hypothetical protein
VHKVDPLAREVGKSSEVLGRREPLRLEAPHLTRRSKVSDTQGAAAKPSYNRVEQCHTSANRSKSTIARVFAPNCEKPSSELRTRIKRLLELDRSIGRSLQKNAERANFGFFSEKAPGTGAVIFALGIYPGPKPLFSFSEYEAFALLNGLRIMKHGWPQGFAVSIMRRVRLGLEREHARILRQYPGKLFDQ